MSISVAICCELTNSLLWYINKENAKPKPTMLRLKKCVTMCEKCIKVGVMY